MNAIFRKKNSLLHVPEMWEDEDFENLCRSIPMIRCEACGSTGSDVQIQWGETALVCLDCYLAMTESEVAGGDAG